MKKYFIIFVLILITQFLFGQKNLRFNDLTISGISNVGNELKLELEVTCLNTTCNNFPTIVFFEKEIFFEKCVAGFCDKNIIDNNKQTFSFYKSNDFCIPSGCVAGNQAYQFTFTIFNLYKKVGSVWQLLGNLDNTTASKTINISTFLGSFKVKLSNNIDLNFNFGDFNYNAPPGFLVQLLDANTNDVISTSNETNGCLDRENEIYFYNNNCNNLNTNIKKLNISISPYNLKNELSTLDFHQFKVTVNGDPNIVSPLPTMTSSTTDLALYNFDFKYIDPTPNNNEQNNVCTNEYEYYTKYEIDVCEFKTCNAGGSNCCNALFVDGAFQNKEVFHKKIVYYVYRPLEWVKTTYKHPCVEYKECKLSMGQSYICKDNGMGNIKVNLCNRIGGNLNGNYEVKLCMDKQPDANYDENCARCWTRTVPANSNDVSFYNLPAGNYKLTIESKNGDLNDCGVYTEFINLVLANQAPLAISPSPAFICPNTSGSAISPSVTITASQGFLTYNWKYECDGSATSSTTNQLVCTREQGGVYTLTVFDGVCSQTKSVTVVDLNIPSIELEKVNNVLQTSAAKYEHCATPELSAQQWAKLDDIDTYMDQNSYLSGKSGIYRAKESFDYLDDRIFDKYTTDGNVDIKKTGLLSSVDFFNFSSPGFLSCSPKWKWNSSITKYNPGSYPIESKDILGLYSSSLYGYNGKLAIGVSGLGKYHEIGFESFEEYQLNQTNINQLNNSTGNFDIVPKFIAGSIPYYLEYPIIIGMYNYAIAKFPLSLCPQDNTEKFDLVLRTIPKGKPDCNGAKILESEVDNVEVKIAQNPCPSMQGVLFEFNPKNIPITNEKTKYCTPWNGFVRLTKHKVYPDNLTIQNMSFSNEQAHTGKMSAKLLGTPDNCTTPSGTGGIDDLNICKNRFENRDIILEPNKEYILSVWVFADYYATHNPLDIINYNKTNEINVTIEVPGLNIQSNTFYPSGAVIEGWQKMDATFKTSDIGGYLTLVFNNKADIFIDDIRVSPYNGGMQTYVYDPQDYKLKATLDANNYSTVYKYDDQGNLFLVLKETIEGFKTIQMSQSYIKK